MFLFVFHKMNKENYDKQRRHCIRIDTVDHFLMGLDDLNTEAYNDDVKKKFISTISSNINIKMAETK